ncbi:MarR family winged helix-turn-helix transcriptional regulator [Leucobacter sp. PH1c]|uniref:MarR family winged helix-turn-helix transcriptional regulator n=1 Tax=Leucobacter sp. PH1c TaxID=1397278 RepID=UPI0004A82ED3|nr:MarR family transcriptional regulator [Leucobacter sp. PH1c]
MEDRTLPSVAPAGQAGGSADAANGDTIAEIIAEFSEVIAFARSRWARYAEDVHPDLRGVGLIVLQLILRKGPLTVTGISQMLDMDKAVVSRQISKLRELGLIEAEPAPEDRRVVLLTGSARAQELIDAIRVKWADAYHERFGDWSAEELEELRAGLHRFNASADHSVARDTPSGRCTRGEGPEDSPAA